MSSQELVVQQSEDEKRLVVNGRQCDIANPILEFTKQKSTYHLELTHGLKQQRITLHSQNHQETNLESSFLQTGEVLSRGRKHVIRNDNGVFTTIDKGGKSNSSLEVFAMGLLS